MYFESKKNFKLCKYEKNGQGTVSVILLVINIISLAEPTSNIPIPLPEPEPLTASKMTFDSKQFARLSSDEYTFEVREDLDTIEFAESQFQAWINYLKKKLKTRQETQQSEGVPNQ